MWIVGGVLVLLLGASQGALETRSAGSARVHSLSRYLDLSSANVEEHLAFRVSAPPSNPAKLLPFAFPSAHADSLALARASISPSSGSRSRAAFGFSSHSSNALPSDLIPAFVHFPQPLSPGESANIVLNLTFVGLLRPYPESVSQGERQSMLYSGSLRFPLPSPPDVESLSVKLPSSTVHSFSQPTNSSATHRGTIIDYGTFNGEPAGTSEELRLHFPSDVTYLVASVFSREYVLSHRGQLRVTEDMMLRNDGAGLKGGFSRYEFGKGVGSAITYLQAVLPSGASDVDLSDELGKITTLRVSESRDRVHALITPRFPLLRGWKAKLTLMYTIPAVHMLRAGEGQDMAVLSMSAWPPLTGVTAVEEFSMRVVLPEGASNISLRAPFATSTSESTTKGFTNAIAKQMRTVHKRLLVREDPSAVAEVAFKTSSLPRYTGPGVIAASIAAVAGGCTAVASIPTPSFWRLKAERGKAATKIER